MSTPPDETFIPINPSQYHILHLKPNITHPPDIAPSGTVDSSSSVSKSSYHTSESFTHSAQQIHPAKSPPDELITFRYTYAQDEHGNHVVVGREGVLQRCEDEPIRTPGAVQAFGVLIAVEELEDTLVVRQVSEVRVTHLIPQYAGLIQAPGQNSTLLLGLPPSYLFTLECFTDTLPPAQADILWDNIQFTSTGREVKPDEAKTSSTNEEDSIIIEDQAKLRDAVREENSPHVFTLSGWGAPDIGTAPGNDARSTWSCWCALHRSGNLIVMEFELELDLINPLYPPDNSGNVNMGPPTLGGDANTSHANAASPAVVAQNETPDIRPSDADILESTTSRAKPLPALDRLRHMTRKGPVAHHAFGTSPGGTIENINTKNQTSSGPRRRRRGGTSESSSPGMMDIFAVMTQINEQLGAADDLDTFLGVLVGVLRDLTQFHRVLVYQFDEMWNGCVVAELLDWEWSKEVYKGLSFPAGDIPKQARDLYMINKVRLLYDRSQPAARIVVGRNEDLGTQLDMTHCYLRAMSPIHVKYLENMGVRASMSISILAFGQLWGLVACHSYGTQGMRVSFPVRQMLRLLSQSMSRNIERLSYAQRLHTKKFINTMSSDQHPTGYIVSDADDLVGLFDADCGILVIGEGAKILGPDQQGQEILIMADYLRSKRFNTIQASQAVTKDYPDLELSSGLEVVAGLLYVPLSKKGGQDFIAFLRRGQNRSVHWAGKPRKDGESNPLEPRTSFKIWSETVAGRCRMWTDEQLETAGVLSLVYGKFIEVWRQKETAVKTTKLTSLLLSNASHEVRTPLNHIINYLEMAMDGPIDEETQDILKRSHSASKVWINPFQTDNVKITSKGLLFTINDLLDLTRVESGQKTSFNEPFNLHRVIEDAIRLYRKEADRRNIQFHVDLAKSPIIVIGDAKKVQTVVQNLTANALQYTTEGSITVRCATFVEPEGLRDPSQTAVEIIVSDTGCGIPSNKLESIFREFEQIEPSEPNSDSQVGLGLGLAVVARIVEQLGGRLHVESKVNEGSRFSLLVPMALGTQNASLSPISPSSRSSSMGSARVQSRAGSSLSGVGEIENLVEALASNHVASSSRRSPEFEGNKMLQYTNSTSRSPSIGVFEVKGSHVPVRPVKVDDYDKLPAKTGTRTAMPPSPAQQLSQSDQGSRSQLTYTTESPGDPSKLRVLIVEDNDISRTILVKRLSMQGHTILQATNGQECLTKVTTDRSFDVILMDIQMPILNGFQATQRIRELEKSSLSPSSQVRLSGALNGRIPIFAVSASLMEQQREELIDYGMDGWIMKPIDFNRLQAILNGVVEPKQRRDDMYRLGCDWENGGWFKKGRGLP